MPENVFSKRVMSALPRCPDEHVFDILNGLAIERDDIVTTLNLVSDLELSIETIQNSRRRSPCKIRFIYGVPLHLQPLELLPNYQIVDRMICERRSMLFITVGE